MLDNVVENLSEVILSISDPLWSYVLVAFLLIAGLYFTFGTNFVVFRYFGKTIKLLGENVASEGNSGVSSYQAYAISIASRVGIGNIAGVATAIAIGGPGAVFWLWVFGILGMAPAFVESTLAQIYKVKDGENFVGGPAYYITNGLGVKWLGVVFALLLVFSYGFIFNLVQSSTVAGVFTESFNFSSIDTGIFLSILSALVIFGGVKRVGAISGILLPLMLFFYIYITFIILIMNFSSIGDAFMLIFTNAFNGESAHGGLFGTVLMQGVKRGIYSNEAGVGSAPNAAATAHTSHPVKQGLVQSFSVFTGTMIICTCTALMVILAGRYTSGESSVALAQLSLTSQLGTIGNIFVDITIFLFAYSTIIGNYYYAEANFKFLKNKPWLIWSGRIGALVFIFLGAIMEFNLAINLADLFMGLMAVINIYAIMRLFPKVRTVLKDFDDQIAEGYDPVFYKENLPGLETDNWDGDEFDESDDHQFHK